MASAAAAVVLNQDLLRVIIEGSKETWTYAIFWKSSIDFITGVSQLDWGDGYYSGCTDEESKQMTATSSTPSPNQEHRKRVLTELNSLIAVGGAAASDEAVEEEVTDTEWFFLVSMTHSFCNGLGLPGQSLFVRQPTWIATGLSYEPCERVRQAYTLGIRTMVSLPVGDGVLELGSTQLILQTADSMPNIYSLINLRRGQVGS